MYVAGTEVKTEVVSDPDVPLLTVDLNDLSEEYLRPDFIDDMFFPPSDSEEEEDIDHLCEQMGNLSTAWGMTAWLVLTLHLLSLKTILQAYILKI